MDPLNIEGKIVVEIFSFLFLFKLILSFKMKKC